MFRLAEFPPATPAVLFRSCFCYRLRGLDGVPNVQPTPAQVSLVPIYGNDYAGHAPIVGGQVFVPQAGTGGYGVKSTSLLSATYSGSTYPTAPAVRNKTIGTRPERHTAKFAWCT